MTRAKPLGGSVGALLLLLIPIGYLVLTPLIRLQQLALEDDARAYKTALDVRNLDI